MGKERDHDRVLAGLRRSGEEMNQGKTGLGPEKRRRQEAERPAFFPPHKKSSQLCLGALKEEAGSAGLGLDGDRRGAQADPQLQRR